MAEYIIDDLTKSIYAERPKIKANSPKEATQKALNCKVKRVKHGGDIVTYNCHTGRSFVYERLKNE